MKFDFSEDRRLMQVAGQTGGSSSGKSALAKQIEAALYKVNTTPKGPAKDAAVKELFELNQQNSLVQVAEAGPGTLAGTAIELMASEAKKRQEAANSAIATDLQIQATKGNNVAQAKLTESQSKFSAEMIVANAQLGMIGSIKAMEIGVCAIAKLLGRELDTSGFDAYIDNWEKKVKAKLPNMNTSGIEGVSSSVSSVAAADKMSSETAVALSKLSLDSNAINAFAEKMSAAAQAREGTPQKALPHSISIEKVRQDIADLQKSGAITSNVDFGPQIKKAAASDGNANDFSAKDAVDLNTRIESVAGKDVAAKVAIKLESDMTGGAVGMLAKATGATTSTSKPAAPLPAPAPALR